MNVNNKHIELFDKYLDGELSSKWIKAFEGKLVLDLSFKEAFEEHKLVRYAIKTEGKAMLKKELIALTPSLPKANTYTPKKGGFLNGLLIIGVLINLTLVSWYLLLPCLSPELNNASENSRKCLLEGFNETESSHPTTTSPIDTLILPTKKSSREEDKIEKLNENKPNQTEQIIEDNYNSDEVSNAIIDTNIIYLYDTVFVDEKGVPVDIQISTPNDTAVYKRVLQNEIRKVDDIQYRYDSILVKPGEDFDLPEKAIIVKPKIKGQQ